MRFELKASIVTVGPFEPALVAAIALALLGAVGIGRALAAITDRVKDPWRRVIYLGPVWFIGGLIMFALPNVAVAVLYPLFHPEDRGAMVCVAMVWPLFMAAPVAGYAVGAAALRHARVLAQRATPRRR
jgi:hypothetical protein